MATSWMSISYPRWRKEEYTAKTGTSPCLAMPAAMATAWPSAMPTSKNRFGKRAAKPSSPVPGCMAAVTAHTRPSSSARRHRVCPKLVEKFSLGAPRGCPVVTSYWETPWYSSGSSSAG